jgi:hypothetical protein
VAAIVCSFSGARAASTDAIHECREWQATFAPKLGGNWTLISDANSRNEAIGPDRTLPQRIDITRHDVLDEPGPIAVDNDRCDVRPSQPKLRALLDQQLPGV